MRDIILFFYVCLLTFLTAFPASVQASTLWQKGGLYPGKILDLRYTSDSKNLVLICTGTAYDQTYRYQVCQYNIADRHFDTLLMVNSYHSPLLSPDTRFLLCDNAINDTVRIWSLSQRQLITLFALGGKVSEQGRVWTDDNYLAVVISDTVKRFNGLNGVMESSFVITPNYSNVESKTIIAGNGKWVYLLTSDPARNTAYTELWNIRTREHTVWPRAQGSTILAFDGRYIVYGSLAGPTVVYDTDTHTTMTTVAGTLFNVTLLPEGYLAGQVIERNANLYPISYHMSITELATGRHHSMPIFDVNPAVPNPWLTLYFSHDQTSFVAVINIPEDYNELIPAPASAGFSIYNLPDSSIADTWPASGHIGAIKSLVVSPDGTYGASTGDDLQTLLWDIKAGTSTGRLAGKGQLAFSPDSTALIRANLRASALEKISIDPFTVIQSAPLPQIDVKTLRFSSDKRFLLCVSPSGIAVYSWPTLQHEYNIFSTPDIIADAAFTADANNLVIVTFNKNLPGKYTVHIRNTVDSSLLSQKVFSGNLENQVVQLSQDGSLLIIFSSSRLTIHRTSDGEIVRDISPQMISPSLPALSPDGMYIFLVGRASILTGLDDITYYHVFKAFSLYDPTDDITFDNTVLERGSPSLTAMLPAGTKALYICRNSYRTGRLYYTDLTVPSLPLILSDTRSVHIAPSYTGIPSIRQIRLAISVPAPGIVTGITLSDSTLIHTVSVHYSHTLPDTVKAYRFNDFNAPVITLTINPLYAGSLSFSLVVAVAGHSWRDTLRIPVTATITGPAMTFDVEEIDFGSVAVGSRVERVFYLWNNNDTALLYLTSARVKDTTYQIGLNIPESFPTFLTFKNDLPVTVSYVPTNTDSLNAAIIFTSNDPLRPEVHIPIRGRGKSTVGVSENQQDGTIQLSPNPVGSILTISFPAPVQVATVELFSAGGRCMAVQQVATGEQTVTFDTTTLSSGVYYCRMTTASGTITKPVLILH